MIKDEPSQATIDTSIVQLRCIGSKERQASSPFWIYSPKLYRYQPLRKIYTPPLLRVWTNGPMLHCTDVGA